MPLIFGGLTVILIQILCAVHCVRSGRNQGWLMVIIFLPLVGSLAYFVIEILPGMGQTRELRAAKAAAVKAVDPEREVRAAQEAIEVADTAASRLALADRLTDLERWGEAIPHYEIGIAKAPRPERGAGFRLARAQYQAGRAVEARATIAALPETGSPSERDRTSLLLAKVLDEVGEHDAALALYGDVGERLPGGEAQCRAAALLLRLDRRDEARAMIEEVERRLKRIDRHERAAHRDMYDWAARTLAELRGG